jgi:hypothetical protein
MNTPSHSADNTGSINSSLFLAISRFVYRLRFAVPSIMIHAAIVILFGGAVIVKHVIETPQFEAPSGDLVGAENMRNGPEPPVDPPTNDPSPAAAVVPSTSVFVLASSAATSSFSVVNTPIATTAGTNTGDMAKVTEAIAKGAGKSAGAGVMGGTKMFFGAKEKTTNALVGTFYDIKQTRRKKPTGVTTDEYAEVYRKFVWENFRESVLKDYFQAPSQLYATQFFIPDMNAEEGPKAFEVDSEVQPSRWLVHYKGRISPPEDGTYHFVGGGDDVMVIRVNGKLVFDHGYASATDWKPERYYNYHFTGIPNGFAKGDAMRMKAGQFYDIEMLIGEQPGGRVFFILLVEKEGEVYDVTADGNPILPIFRLADVPVPEAKLGEKYPPYKADGPIWRAQTVKTASRSMFDEFFGPRP